MGRKWNRTILLSVIHLVLMVKVGVAQEQIATNSLKKGDVVPSIAFIDEADQSQQLDQFKGKYVLIDVWASWCYPCRKEFPALDSLRQHYKGRNLVVLGVSIDTQKFRWLGMKNNHDLPGPQWMTQDTVFNDVFGIMTIPRIILLGPDGKVYNERMPKPSDPAIYRLLDSLLGKG